MNKFISSLLGAFVGTWIAFFVMGIIMFICAIIAVSSMSISNMKTPVVSISDQSILRIDLAGNITERPYNRTIQDYYTGSKETSDNLSSILSAIKIAADNNHVAGIYVNCKGASMGLASAKAIRDALQQFKTSSGKWIYAYGDELSQGDYYIASVADSIFMNPVGALDIHGLGSGVMFYKGLLDKLGVEMQIVRVGTYKSAVEPFMLTHMSDANKLQTQTFLNNIWNNMVNSIAVSRKMKTTAINAFADSMDTYKAPTVAVKAKLIDGLCYEHQFESKIKQIIGQDDTDDLNFVSTFDLNHSSKKQKLASDKIAVLYAVGDINVSGVANAINSEDMVPIILDLAKDDDIKGLVVRVNSPGGSAFASEQIWEALSQFKKEGKPFAVSMGDYAASGGYYISCGADRIFAEPTTITGSIGIFGMIPSFENLMTEKLGINVEFITTNANSDMSTFKRLTPVQRASLQKMVNRGYELFTSRCATGRKMPVDSLKKIAEGRVWDAQSALKIGLVDEFGNIDNAVEWVAKKAHLAENYSVVEYPEYKEDLMNMLLTSLSNSAYEAKMESLYGDSFKYLQEIRNILNQDKLQCRMMNISIE